MKTCPLIIILISAAVLMADSAVMYDFPDGRSVALTSSGDISMAAETVSITPEGSMFNPYGGYEEGFLPHMNVQCIFHLVNESDYPQDITVGFPIDAKYGYSYTVYTDSMLVAYNESLQIDKERMAWYESGLHDGVDALEAISEDLNFTAEVDGEPMEVFYRTCSYSVNERMFNKPVVAVWSMHFEPGQICRLVNTYTTAWDFYGAERSEDYTIRYVLTTGSTWKGPIGNAVITLQIPDELPSPILSDTLMTCWDWTGSPDIEGRTVKWEYSQWEPDENLEFTVMTVWCSKPWNESLSAPALVEAVTWSEEELLTTAGDYILWKSSVGYAFNQELVLRILEAALHVARHRHPPDSSILYVFDNVQFENPVEFNRDDKLKLRLLDSVRSNFESDIELMREAGYFGFLPLFVVKYMWDYGDIDQFASDPNLENRYLDILENLETARAGGDLSDSVIEIFYNILAWYHPDNMTRHSPAFTDSIAAYRENI